MEPRMLVSFDFDSTLTQPRWDEENEMWESRGPNWSTLRTLMWHIQQGDTVIIVTARRRAMEDYTAMGAAMAVENFVEKYQVPVAGIHFTEGQLKGKTLRRMGVDLHYDDDEEEIEEAEVWGVDTVWVKHPADE